MLESPPRPPAPYQIVPATSRPMKAEIYTTSTCPFCHATLSLLQERGIEVENHVMDSDPLGLMEVKKLHGHRTVPIILLDGEFIGGNDDLQRLDAAGKLVASS